MQMNNSSKPYKIFGQGRGIDVSQYPQGRNVQPFSTTNTKKLDQGSQRQIQSPFDGYGPVTAVENNLAMSQVSDLNLELTRRIVKDQISKFGGVDQSKTRNDIQIMKTQMRSLKQYISQINNKSGRDDQQLKKEILKDFDKLLQQYHEQTARNLRQVIKRFDQSIKKDCSSKYLPLGFVNDAQNQFLQLQDRIQLVQSKLNGNKKQKSEDPVILAEAFQLKLKKAERQVDSIKKNVAQIQNLLQNLNQSNSALRSKQNDDDERTRQKIEQVKKNSAQIQKEIKNLTSNLEQLKNNQKQFSQKILIIEQTQSKSPQKWANRQNSNEQSQVKQFLQSSKGLSTSSVYQVSGQNGDGTYKQLFKSPMVQNLSHKSSTQSIDDGKPIPESSQDKPICYRIDKQNNLLDDDGNYILNQQGKEIKLSEQQIAMLRKSTLVKLRE